MRREVTAVLAAVLMLCAIGLVTVFSASPRYTDVTKGEGQAESMYSFLTRQAFFLGVGVVVMFAAARFDYHLFRRKVYLWALILGTVALLAAVLVAGIELNGAKRWLAVPGGTIQPSEVAKLTLVVVLAVVLSRDEERTRSLFRGFVPALGVIAFFTGLIVLQRDLSTPAVIGASTMLLLVMAGARWWHLGLSAFPAVAAFIYLCLAEPYRLERLYAFRDPWKYSGGKGLQLIQSLCAFTRGGMWGQGLGAGEQKLFFLPEPSTDTIFAVWGEEMGLAGTLLLVVLFAVFLVMGLRIALCAPDLLGALLAAGVVTVISFQAAINMGVATGLLPTTGLPLPFISAGGSALVVYLAMIGILLNVGMQAAEPEATGRLAPVGAKG